MTLNTSIEPGYLHRQELAAHGFVHEHLPASHNGAGSWFVLETEWGTKQPSIRVTVDEDSTEICTFDGYELLWHARFSPETPATIIGHTIAATIN